MPAKRPNGILIGTILVVLIGALIFVQAQFMASGGDEEDADPHGAPPVESPNTPGHTPTVEELQNQMRGTGQGPAPGNPGPTSSPNAPAPVQAR